MKREKLKRKFTKSEISQLIGEGCIYDEKTGRESFCVVDKKIVHHDSSKNSTDVEYVIEDVENSRFYRAELLDSVWIHQNEYNAGRDWEEVFKKTITKIVYE